MESRIVLGVDVSKKSLDACLLVEGGHGRDERRFKNDAKGIRSLLEWGKKSGASVLGMESTGGYERELALAGVVLGFVVRVENPRRIKDFARAMGCLNKTDRADARAIALFLSKIEGRAWRLADPAVRELEGLTHHRSGLVARRTQILGKLEHRGVMPLLAVRQLEEELARLEVCIAETEKARLEILRSDAGLSRDYEVLIRLLGMGAESTALVLARAGNVEDYASAQSYAARAGTTPCRRESGEWRGRTRISKQGDAVLRAGLFMAAMAASRHDPVLKEFRERLIARGKTRLQAIIACQRKLLMRIYGILKAVRSGKTPYYGYKPQHE